MLFDSIPVGKDEHLASDSVHLLMLSSSASAAATAGAIILHTKLSVSETGATSITSIGLEVMHASPDSKT